MIKVFNALIKLEELEITPQLLHNYTGFEVRNLYHRKTLLRITNILNIYHNHNQIDRIVVPTILAGMITDASLFHVSVSIPAPKLDGVLGKLANIDVVLAKDFNDAYIKVEYKKTWLRKIKLNEMGYSDVDDNILDKIIIEDKLLPYIK